MDPSSHGQNRSNAHRIELKLWQISTDSTPGSLVFPRKGLDHAAEEFIIRSTRELRLDEPVALLIHLGALPPESSRDAEPN